MKILDRKLLKSKLIEINPNYSNFTFLNAIYDYLKDYIERYEYKYYELDYENHKSKLSSYRLKKLSKEEKKELDKLQCRIFYVDSFDKESIHNLNEFNFYRVSEFIKANYQRKLFMELKIIYQNHKVLEIIFSQNVIYTTIKNNLRLEDFNNYNFVLDRYLELSHIEKKKHLEDFHIQYFDDLTEFR